MKYPTPPFLHDDGKLVVRGLAPRRYIGLRIPEMRGFKGENTERVVMQYDSVVAGEMRERAGLRAKPKRVQSAMKHEEQGARQDRVKKKEEAELETLRLQIHWLTRPWA